MDLTTIIAGPAQAGSPSPVSKPGIGFTAGAGPAPAADVAADGGFATLVELALDQIDGVASMAGGNAAGTSGHAPLAGDGAADALGAESDDESPLDAPVDAATLSLLIALATPLATPIATPVATPVATPGTLQPDVVGQGGSDLAAVDGDAGGRAVTLPAQTADAGTASRTAASAATPAFGGVLASVAPAAAPTAVGATSQATAVPTEGVAATLPQSAPAPAPAPESPAEAEAAAVPPAAPRAGLRQAPHPLRQALDAMAAAVASDTTSVPASQPAVTMATPRTAGVFESASAPASAPVSAAATVAGHEGRLAAASRVDTAAMAPVAAVGAWAASDSGSTGDGSPDDARDGFAAAASTLVRGTESRLELPAAFPPTAPASGPDTATAATLPSIAGFGAGFGTGFGAAADSMLRAIDVPAAVRFEQTLSSVDPDVRNLQAMVRTVRLFTAADGAHEARLNLEPEHLGPVGLTVRVEQGSVSAHFRAETPAAQRWIETHQQELRAGLREQGLEVKDVVVTTDPDGRRDRRQDAQPVRPHRPRRLRDADAPRFEVLV